MPGDRRQLGQHRLEQPQVAEVLAVGRGVLADEEQLLDAVLRPASAPRRGRRRAGARRTRRGTSGWRRTRSAGRSRWRSSAAPTAGRRAGPGSPAARTRAPAPRSSRRRRLVQHAARADGARGVGRRAPWPGSATGRPCWRAAGDSGSSLRRSDGHVRGRRVPVEDRRSGGWTCRRRSRTRAPRRPRAARRRAARRTARPGSRRRRPPGCGRSSLRSDASSSASIESFLACSTKPQVLTTATSASAASSTSSHPSAARRPASSSESTSLRVQPEGDQGDAARQRSREGSWSPQLSGVHCTLACD